MLFCLARVKFAVMSCNFINLDSTTGIITGAKIYAGLHTVVLLPLTTFLGGGNSVHRNDEAIKELTKLCSK